MTKFSETGVSYRTAPTTVEEKEIISFEEKIANFRKALPGPVRRTLGLVFFVPIHILSFILAVIAAPFVWILYGEIDRHCAKFSHSRYGFNSYYTTGPLLSGTNVLFSDDNVYRDVRLGKRTKYVDSGDCTY